MLKVVQPNGREKKYVELNPDSNGPVVTYRPMKKNGTPDMNGKPVYLRGIAHALIINSDNQLLLTQRSRGRFAGYTDIGVTGTIEPGEEIQETAMRELEEELGIRKGQQGGLVMIALGFHVTKDAFISITTFGIRYDGPIHPNPDEISCADFIKPERVLREKRHYK